MHRERLISIWETISTALETEQSDLLGLRSDRTQSIYMCYVPNRIGW